MRKSLYLIAAGLAICGCSGEPADNTKETKASEVKLDMTEQQKAEIAEKFKNPDWNKR